MNIYSACIRLDIWNVVRARAEVWSMSESPSNKSLDELKVIARKAYKSLVMNHHPDRGGESSVFIDIQKASELVQNATHRDFINALDDEKKSIIVYHKPGSAACSGCIKWSDIINTCITVTCSGFEEPPKRRFANVRGTTKLDFALDDAEFSHV